MAGQYTITRCNMCGRGMEKGERVTLALQWEHPKTVRIWNGEERDVVGVKSATKKVCRECAEKVAFQANIRIPEEASL